MSAPDDFTIKLASVGAMPPSRPACIILHMRKMQRQHMAQDEGE